jgi:hypothetical protein
MKTKILSAAILTATLLAPALRAEEAGSGHYLPGATASFIDVPPGKEGFIYVNAFTFYNGSATAGKQLELGGQVVLNANADVYADTSLFLYQTPWKIAGGHYAAGIAVPYVWMDVSADVQVGKHGVKGRDTANGFGDVQILPLMLVWKQGDLSYGFNLGIYAPTGDFKKGALANIGKNYWTFEPTVYVSWLSSKIGLELSAFAGFDFNTKNDTTDYQSGTTFHVDATVAQHLPVGKGFLGIGANAYYYQQISADSGSGAKLGGFEGRTTGIGPVLSYATKVGGKDVVAELKWLPELGVQKRLSGDTIWFKVAVAF